jgi:hypothetical protein
MRNRREWETPARTLVVSLLVALTLAVLLPRCGSGRRQVPVLRGTGAGVHGSVITEVSKRLQVNSKELSDHFIYVPDFEVFLRNAAGTETARVKTDLFGRYIIKLQKPGRYQLCWNGSGWVAGCAPDPIVIGSNTKYPPPTTVTPMITDKTGPVIGRVRQADGTSPWFADQYFGVEQTAIVSAIRGGNRIGEARANVAGDYVLTGMPRNGVEVVANLGSGSTARNLTAADFSTGGAFAPLTLTNRRPALGSMTVFSGGRGVRESAAGVALDVELDVFDPDGDPLTIRWKAAPGNGEISGGGNRARWELPREGGRRVVYALVDDGKGGIAQKSVSIASGSAEVQFSGSVIMQSGQPIPGASIEINGNRVAVTDAKGTFSASVPIASSYVVNASRRGFATFSRIYDHGNLRDVYPLVRGQSVRFIQGSDIAINDNREELQRKKVRGAQLLIRGGSLVPMDGGTPALEVDGVLATLDITNAEMPGNYGAIASGRETNLISFGAIFAEFTDASGRRYNLRPGSVARMTLPVPEAMLATAPEKIVLWSYNERTGFWEDDGGEAVLDRGKGAYVGEVRHFSTINTDIAKQDATCLKLSLDPSVPLGEVKVRVSYESGPTPFVQVPELLLDQVDNALFRLPANDTVKIQVFDAAGNVPIGDAIVLDNGITPAPGGVVNLGGPTLPLFPGPPFANCHPVVIALQVPAWGGFSSSPFLTYPGGSEPLALGYYAAVDPGTSFNAGTQTWSGGTRDTLGDWWSQAGFGPNGEDNGGKRAAYLNHNDLGFGRDMHIRTSGSDVFAYVTNYGAPDQNPANADAALAANQATAGATVCMEYTTQPGVTGRIVKFFVYNGGTGTAKLINSANLDGFGEKFVPNLCQNCHGGEFYNPAVPASPSGFEVSLRAGPLAVTGASFREFDAAAFRYPGGAVTPDATTEQALFDLNQLVKLSQPQPAIIDLIDGWYLGGTPTQDSNFTPAAWQASVDKIDLYRKVVGTSCRTCHIGFGSDPQNQGLNWVSYTQFQQQRTSVEFAVCGSYKYMPHALITYRNFWLSTGPHRPDTLRNFTASDWVAFGNCQ